MPRLNAAMCLAGMMIVGGVYAAGETGALRVNPFIPPQALTAAGSNTAGDGDGAMDLRGVVVAGEHSLADIGGHVVEVGQEIHGYRLVTVNEGKVVLERDGTQRVLKVRKQDGVGNDVQVNASW